MAYDKFAAVDSSTLLFPPSVRENLAGVSPNVIINGGFDIWQRGTSFSYSSPTVTYTADRWNITNAGGSGTAGFTISQQSVVGNAAGTQYALRFQRNASNTATTFGYMAYNVETKDSLQFANKSVTLSFYARAGANYSPTSSVLNFRIAYGTGTDQSMNSTGYTGQVNSDTTATLTTSWQRFTLTASIGSSATQVGVQLWSQFTGTAGAADYYEITGVQVEAGAVATPFRRNANSLQGELAACQRYYVRYAPTGAYQPVSFGFQASTTVAISVIHVPVEMRIVPTVAVSQMDWSDDVAFLTPLSSISVPAASDKKIIRITTNYGASGAQFRPGMIRSANTSTAFLELSAEL
jgi:hypothetical protein